MRQITLISTGGTIEKTYDEATGELLNRHSVVQRMLSRLRLEDINVNSVQLMHKDSRDMTDADRHRVLDAVRLVTSGNEAADGVVVLHGTDTLADTGEVLCAELVPPPVPVVLTGAMRPYEMRRSDALQNLTESVFAAGVLEPGVYCVAHGRVHRFPGVQKDRTRGTFVSGAQRPV